MKQIIFVFGGFTLLSLFSCSSEHSDKELSKTNIKIQTNEVVANRVMTAQIEGMSCEVKQGEENNCEQNLRQELIDTKAIESCEVDYQNDRKVNLIKVAFDKDKISVDELVNIITNIHEPSLKLHKVRTHSFESTNEVMDDSPQIIETFEDSKFKMKEEVIETPNILELFSRLITG